MIIHSIKNSQIRKIRMLEVRIRELESDKEFYRASLLKMLDRQEKIDKAIKQIEDYNIKTNFASCSEAFQLGVTKGLDLASEILKRNIRE